MKKVVAVILKNNKNQFLLYLRDNKKSIVYPNYWSLLGGGVEENETLLKALKREIKEEIDYCLRDVYYVSNFYDLYGNLVHVYKSHIDKELNELVLTEGQKLKYFSFEEIMEIKIPKVLKEFLIKNRNKIIND